MNIFLTSADTTECAKDLCDLRLNKMILETAQILCVGFRHHFPKFVPNAVDLYKPTHMNHPCCMWIKQHPANYAWLHDLFASYAVEKYFRTGKWHLSYTKLYVTLGQPILATPLPKPYLAEHFTFDCSNVYGAPNVFEAYKECLRRKWYSDARTPKWTNRDKPSWYERDAIAA